MKVILGIVAAAGVTLAATSRAEEPIVVVVNSENPLSRLEPESVKEIFLGKVDTFPGTSLEVKVVDLKNDPVRDAFYAAVTGKDQAWLSSYRAKLVFTGRGKPTTELTSRDAVREAVERDPGAISYLPKSKATGSVKVVMQVAP